MDQENSKGQDKRNWRERLGIGAQGAPGGKDLPKISDDFRKEPSSSPVRPAAPSRANPRPVAAAVKPAPMAPRANPKAMPPPPPVSPDKLAERLRSQREATTRMADQRVQVAKQRVEVAPAVVPAAAVPQAPPPPPPPAPAAKPKFTFAEDGGQQANGAAAAVRPAGTPPQPSVAAPQLSPARPPLGGGPAAASPPAFQPRSNVAPPAYSPQPGPGYPPQNSLPPSYQQGYNQAPVPPYRPIDPMTGYPGQTGYVPPPPRGFGVPPQQGGFAPPNGPRLNVPPRPDLPQRQMPGLNPGYPPQGDMGGPQPGYAAPNPRLTRPPLRGPAVQEEYDDDGYDELASPRAGRPNSDDYQQAYREAEYGYDDEPPRSKTPWILAGLLLTTLLAATPTKKQIYDRIVGDQEVPAGDVLAPAETPSAIPEPSNAGGAATDPAGAGEDAAPLPIPPPPGGAGDQQGEVTIDPAAQKQSAETITPAAGESQAAVAADGAASDPELPVPPAPGEVASAAPKARGFDTPAADDTADTAQTEEIVPETPASAPVKKKAEKKSAGKKLGAKPVVLVAPSKKEKAAAAKRQAGDQLADNAADGGLYGSTDITAPAAPVAEVAAPQPKKKRTLADLFKSDEELAANDVQVATVDPPAEPVARKTVTPAPKPVQPVAQAGGYVVQLASFRSRSEATSEFGRLKAKHGSTLSGFSPIISEAQVGGSTRYRLSVGSMANPADANAVCSSLFAKGERDCLVKKL
jgi:SPOR domain